MFQNIRYNYIKVRIYVKQTKQQKCIFNHIFRMFINFIFRFVTLFQYLSIDYIRALLYNTICMYFFH